MHLRPLGQLSTSIFQSVFPTNKNSFKKLLGRKTGKKTKNYSIFKFENPNKIKVFLRTKLPNGLKFSSHVRYDHFDTSPCIKMLCYFIKVSPFCQYLCTYATDFPIYSNNKRIAELLFLQSAFLFLFIHIVKHFFIGHYHTFIHHIAHFCLDFFR